ncbi:expressed protein [Dictyostelium purpureum]|uniref:Expressed protein n=1 Tax=Dictyostelium purpureum TaxID=5786 RepID=F0ZW26_DICPU|nr:uncharacterized protein DICPUDRAFT_92709 [Dictyostelium purpureum]EGC31847.1 expressed protein [Dictyostelium purpureum]|eukprot:XP_003291617.1 expressed protein [Dictyostelium purpureum]
MVVSNSSLATNYDIISNNSYIQPTAQSNFTTLHYYLNGNSKLEVDHSTQDSNFTVFGHLVANENAIIGLKQIAKLSPHLIITGNLTTGGCSLEIVFDEDTEDLHAEYTILESEHFNNQFNNINVYNGKTLMDRKSYELTWRGRMCYLLNDVDMSDFAKSTLNFWSFLTILAILGIVILLFAFYKFYKNKFKKKNSNKYEPLEMTDLEKI